MAYSEKVKIVGDIPASQTVQGVTAVPVADANQFEGQSQIELMAQILLELKILNQQIYELAIGSLARDEPQAMRNEPSIFNI